VGAVPPPVASADYGLDGLDDPDRVKRRVGVHLGLDREDAEFLKVGGRETVYHRPSPESDESEEASDEEAEL
jgi:hypothetical protein